jgi:hypothetical protein
MIRSIEHEEIPGSIKQQLVNASFYQLQWLNEAYTEYLNLPVEVRPVNMDKYQTSITDIREKLTKLAGF